MRLGLKFTKDQCPSEADQYKPKTADMQKWYRSLVGSLLWINGTCKPDISFATMTLPKFMANPGHEHYQTALEVLRYLNGTVTLGIGYRSGGNRFPYCYCDSDFASDESRRSCSGYMFMLAGGPISCLSFSLRCLYRHAKQKYEQCIQPMKGSEKLYG